MQGVLLYKRLRGLLWLGLLLAIASLVAGCQDNSVDKNSFSKGSKAGVSGENLDVKSYAQLRDVFYNTGVIKSDGKPVLLVFGRDGCKWCEKLKDDIKNNTRLKDMLKASFHSYYVNGSYSKAHKIELPALLEKLKRLGIGNKAEGAGGADGKPIERKIDSTAAGAKSVEQDSTATTDAKSIESNSTTTLPPVYISTQELERVYEIDPTPTLIFATKEGKTILIYPGYMMEERFLAILEFIKEGRYKGLDDASIKDALQEYLSKKQA